VSAATVICYQFYSSDMWASFSFTGRLVAMGPAMVMLGCFLDFVLLQPD
jgi:hypothetical protein